MNVLFASNMVRLKSKYFNLPSSILAGERREQTIYGDKDRDSVGFKKHNDQIYGLLNWEYKNLFTKVTIFHCKDDILYLAKLRDFDFER